MRAEPSRQISVFVNGESTATGAATLAMLIAELGYDQASVATAVNGAFVARSARGDQKIAPGDAIEVVAPRQGG